MSPMKPIVSQRRGKIVTAACWAYLGGTLVVWATLRFLGERWWPATLLLFGPRWLCAAPLALLLPAAAAVRRRSAWPLALAAAVVVGPVMGLCLPWRRLTPAAGVGGPRLRVLTCNAHGRSADPRRLAELVATSGADVVALEEWDRGRLPRPASAGAAWYTADRGELHVESRYAIVGQAAILPGDTWAGGSADRYDVLAPDGPVPIIVVHLASPHDAIRTAVRFASRNGAAVADNDSTRRRQAAAVGRAADAAGPLVVCLGDLNMPSDSESFRESFGHQADAFAAGGGAGFGWTYRTRWTAARIDHVLFGPSWRCRRCWVGPDVGSPHRPVLADLEMPRPASAVAMPGGLGGAVR